MYSGIVGEQKKKKEKKKGGGGFANANCFTFENSKFDRNGG